MAEKDKSVANIVNKTRESGPASQTVIIKLFRLAIKMVSNCTLVIDGLDECAPDSSCLSVTEFIKEVNEAVRGTKTRILVISRPKSGIRQALMGLNSADFSEHEVCKKDVCSDIEVFSKSIVTQKLRGEDAASQAGMIKKMSDQSEGQFHWLKLQQDSLPEGLSQEELQDALGKIPAGLSNLYSRSWSIITHGKDRVRAVLLLRLAVLSLRPLTLREISEAMLVSDEFRSFSIRELLDRLNEKEIKEKILDLCCSFLEIRKQSPESPIEEWTIHPVHFTVKEFYLKVIMQQNSVLSQSDSLRIAAEHSSLAELCIRYMNDPYARRDSTGDVAPSSNSFIEYAARFWNKHAEAGMAQQTSILIEKFFDKNSLSWTVWRKWFDSNNDGWNRAKSDPAIPLCYAIELGFVDVAMAIITKGEERVNYNSCSRTALGVACSKGYEDLARELLAHGAKVGIRDAHGRTAVQYAVMNGNLDLVKLLIVKGADVKINRDDRGRTAVYYAAMNGHSELVKPLIDNGADINLQDFNGVSPFLAASSNGHLDTMRRLIQKGTNVHQLDKQGNGALSKAISNGHINAVRLLIGKGAHSKLPGYLTTLPANAALRSGSTPLLRLLIIHERDINASNKTDKKTILHLASFWGKTDVVKLLVDRGADLTLQDLWGQTPLFFACANGHADIVKFLLQHKADPAIAAHNRQTPLFVACGNGHSDIVELLLKHGANHAIATAETGQTPLIAACCTGHVEIVRLLIKNKVIIRTPDKEGKTPLYAACANRQFKVARLLIEHGADIKSSDIFGNTSLSAAAFGGSLEIVLMLLQKGPSAPTAYSDCYTAVLVASEWGYIDIVERLIEWNGEDIMESDIMDMALIRASRNGHISVVSLLLENGADPNNLGPLGQTPLYESCCNGHLEVLRLLLSYGADIFNKSKTGWLPIHIASLNGHAKIIDLLIENGSDALGSNVDGNTPLELATIKHHADVANVLLKHGVDIDAKDSFGQTSLLIASCEGDNKLAKLLVDNYVDVSITDNGGRTPLFCASANGHFEIVKLLLDNGADMMPNNEGQTPAYIASAMGRINVLRLLIKSGADITAPDTWAHTLFQESVVAINVNELISDTTIKVKAVESKYDLIRNDKSLGKTFHEAGRGLTLINEALSTVKAEVDTEITQAAKTSLESCDTTATLFEAIFTEVSQASGNARLQSYVNYIKGKDTGSLVETLVVGMMEHVCILAKDCAVEAKMQEQLNVLRITIEKLANMESSVSIEQNGANHISSHNFSSHPVSNHNFSNHSSGSQYTTSEGTQNNATGSGMQFMGVTFTGDVYFNSPVQK